MGRGGTAPWVCRFGDGVQCSFQTLFCPEVRTSRLGRTSEMDGSGGIVALFKFDTKELTLFQQRHRKSIMACDRRRGKTLVGVD